MRHNRKVNHLGRKSGHRKAMLSNMASSLILNKRIETTEAKAKALKPYVEPLITKSKEDTTHNRRVVFSYLKDKNATSELFRTIAPKIADRPGGYLRILHTGFRSGDASEMVLLELVDFNEAALTAPKAEKKSTRRSRAKKAETVEEAAPAAEAEAPAAEEAPVVPQVERTTLGDVTGLAALKAQLEKAEAKAEAPVEEAPKADETPKTEE